MKKKILFLALCLYYTLVFSASVCKSGQCMIIIDAGSTGSRAHLYQYQFTSDNRPIAINDIKSAKNSPGLAQFSGNTQELHSYLKQLLASFQSDGQSPLPVYFYATAGMRLLPIDKQNLLYSDIQHWFAEQDNFKLVEAKTISGKEEGVYGWLSVNYLAGAFREDHKPAETIGMMDFGGASIQVAFPVKTTTEIEPSDLTELSIGKQNYKLYTHSFLGLGFNEMLKQFLTDHSCYANNYPLPDEHTGNGDVYSCEQDIEVLTNQVHKVNQVQQLLKYNMPKQWIALGALRYLHNSKPFNQLSSTLRMSQVVSIAQSQVCQLDWNDVKKSDPSNDYLYTTCLASAYYYAITVHGYGVNASMAIKTEISGTELEPDWTYGVVIQKHQSQ